MKGVAFSLLIKLFSLSFSLSLSVLSVVPGRRRTGCRGSLRRLWSSWYASLSAPLSTPWPRATPSTSSRRNTRRAKRNEGKPALTASRQLQKLPPLFSSLLRSLLADTPPLSEAEYQPPSGFSLDIVATCCCGARTSIYLLF